jgi:hypothetical protein
MPKHVQIGADVTKDLRDRVAQYASSLGISESALLHLLVRRELRLNQIDKLQLSASVKNSAPRIRITAHRADPELRTQFLDHVRSHRIEPGVAIASIAEAEMREKWLKTT